MSRPIVPAVFAQAGFGLSADQVVPVAIESFCTRPGVNHNMLYTLPDFYIRPAPAGKTPAGSADSDHFDSPADSDPSVDFVLPGRIVQAVFVPIAPADSVVPVDSAGRIFQSRISFFPLRRDP